MLRQRWPPPAAHHFPHPRAVVQGRGQLGAYPGCRLCAAAVAAGAAPAAQVTASARAARPCSLACLLCACTTHVLALRPGHPALPVTRSCPLTRTCPLPFTHPSFPAHTTAPTLGLTHPPASLPPLARWLLAHRASMEMYTLHTNKREMRVKTERPVVQGCSEWGRGEGEGGGACRQYRIAEGGCCVCGGCEGGGGGGHGQGVVMGALHGQEGGGQRTLQYARPGAAAAGATVRAVAERCCYLLDGNVGVAPAACGGAGRASAAGGG